MDWSKSSAKQPAAAPQKSPWKRIFFLLVAMIPVSAAIALAGIYYTERATGVSGIALAAPPAHHAPSGSVGEGEVDPEPSGEPEASMPVGPVLPALVDKPGSVFFAEQSSYNILFMGLDLNWTDSTNLPSSKDARSDTMFVLNVSENGRRLGMLSIPRDLYIDFPGGNGSDRINSAYSLGGTNLATKTVMHLLHTPIEHTVVVKIAGAKKLVEALGGVSLNVEKDMDYDDNWGHLHVHLKKGWQQLDAENAIGYARFRHDEEGDRGRMRRQQQFINAVLAELRKPEVLGSPETLQKLVHVFKQTVETDMSVAEMLDLARVYKDFDRRRMKSGHIDGDDTYVSGQAVIVPPDPKTIALQVKSVLLGQNLLRAKDVNVEILNASSVARNATTLGDILAKNKGCHVVRVNEFKHNAPVNSCVVLLQRDPDLMDMVAHLVPNVKVQLADELPYTFNPSPETTMLVIVGSDWEQLTTPKPL